MNEVAWLETDFEPGTFDSEVQSQPLDRGGQRKAIEALKHFNIWWLWTLKWTQRFRITDQKLETGTENRSGKNSSGFSPIFPVRSVSENFSGILLPLVMPAWPQCCCLIMQEYLMGGFDLFWTPIKLLDVWWPQLSDFRVKESCNERCSRCLATTSGWTPQLEKAKIVISSQRSNLSSSYAYCILASNANIKIRCFHAEL